MFTYFILVSSPKLYPFFLHFILNITWKFSSHKSHTFSKCFADHHIWRHIQNSRFRLNISPWNIQFPSGEQDWLCIHVCSCNFSYSFIIIFLFSSLQSLSHVWLFVIPWTAAHPASLSITNSQSVLKLMSIESVMSSNHLILCHPLFLLPLILVSIRVFSNESALRIRWPKYWSFSFSISHSNEYSGLISFGMDWLDVLAVQGTLKSLLQHHSSKASILQPSALFIVQLSHPYMTTGKTKALTDRPLLAMSLLFIMLSRLGITFLPRSKRLLISWLQSPFVWTSEPPKRKSLPLSIVSPSICHEVMGPDAMILVFWMLSFKPAFSLSSFTFFFFSPLRVLIYFFGLQNHCRWWLQPWN